MQFECYHGSSKKIDEFNSTFTGKGNDQYGSGFYFTNNKNTALCYGDMITSATVTLRNPFVINGNKNPNLDHIYLNNSDTIYQILLYMPSLFNDPNNENMNPLGDYFAEFWEQNFNNREDYLYFIKRLAVEYFKETSLKNLDIFFKEYPTEFRTALKNVLGHDGIIVNFDNGVSFIIAWFPDQIKIDD